MVLPDDPAPAHEFCRNCGGDNPAIENIAVQHDFTYDEAFTYVLVVGLAYANHPPEKSAEPGE